MAEVTGIGGFFFRAADPEALTQWYKRHFGVAFTGGEPWQQAAGHTVFVPFSDDSDYFASEKRWMINFRVDDLAAFTARLEAAGIEVLRDEAWNSEVGCFARVHDPEGNPIELWEPGPPSC